MTGNGGSAFPELTGGDIYDGKDGQSFSIESAGGMTLRDYFAAAALPLLSMMTVSTDDGGPADEKLLACAVYKMADAMLAEREKQP